jgi:hypothetical protein
MVLSVFDQIALTGASRFRFRDTDYACVQRRLNNCMLADSAGATLFMLEIAQRVLDEYGQSHQIRISSQYAPSFVIPFSIVTLLF